MYSKKNPDDGQRNCPKHVEFYSKNKFEKLVHLVGFIIKIHHDARSSERQITQRTPTGWTNKGSNPGAGRDFLQPSRRGLGPNQPPLK